AELLEAERVEYVAAGPSVPADSTAEAQPTLEPSEPKQRRSFLKRGPSIPTRRKPKHAAGSHRVHVPAPEPQIVMPQAPAPPAPHYEVPTDTWTVASEPASFKAEPSVPAPLFTHPTDAEIAAMIDRETQEDPTLLIQSPHPTDRLRA